MQTLFGAIEKSVGGTKETLYFDPEEVAAIRSTGSNSVEVILKSGVKLEILEKLEAVKEQLWGKSAEEIDEE